MVIAKDGGKFLTLCLVPKKGTVYRRISKFVARP